MTNEEIARAISGHHFDAAYPYLEDDVTWTLVGQGRLEGKEAFIGACETTVAELNGVSTEFRQFRVLAGDDWVVIDSLAAYVSRRRADGERGLLRHLPVLGTACSRSSPRTTSSSPERDRHE